MVVLILAVFFVAGTADMSSGSPAGLALGSALGTRDTSMQTSFGSWMPIDGKTYPVVSGATLKSGNGNISVTLKDFTRIDGGRNTEFVVNGTPAAGSTVTLQKGAVAFRVPLSATLTIITSTAQVTIPAADPGSIKKVSTNNREDRIGAVLYDGKGTRVSSLGGSFSVMNGVGTTRHLLSNGSAVYIGGAEDKYALQQVQLADDPSKLAGGGILAAAETVSPLFFILPGAGAAGAAVAIGSSGGGGSTDIPVSPFRP